MFSLIIVLIGIALVAILAVATVYYGGENLTRGGSQAVAARLANETSQIQSAALMFYQDHLRMPTALSELYTGGKYLNGPPKGWVDGRAEFLNDYYNLDEDACLAYNKRRDIPFVPSCDDEVYANSPVCCQKTATN